MVQQMQAASLPVQVQQGIGAFFGWAWAHVIKPGWVYIVTFQWVKGLLAWALASAGTISEAAFVLAPLWICINASVHPFVRLFLSQALTENISYFADTLLVGIPELIALSAIVTVIFRLGVWNYQGKKWKDITVIWVLAFGIPTAIFLVITVLTLWYSLANVAFQLPMWAVQIRGVAAYWYGIASLLYLKLGKPQEVQRLKEKDILIDELIEENRKSQEKIAELTGEMSALKQSMEQQKQELSSAKREMIQHNETGLQAYAQDCISWVTSENKTADIDEIARYTGHNKQKIRWAIRNGDIKKAGGRGDKYTLLSIRDWLSKTPPPEQSITEVSTEVSGEDTEIITESIPVFTVLPTEQNDIDKLEMTFEILKSNPAITDEELAPLLNLQRPASARFWRLKAAELANATEREPEVVTIS